MFNVSSSSIIDSVMGHSINKENGLALMMVNCMSGLNLKIKIAAIEALVSFIKNASFEHFIQLRHIGIGNVICINLDEGIQKNEVIEATLELVETMLDAGSDFA